MKLKVLAPLVVALATVMSACGESATSSTSVLNLDGTSYSTQAPTLSTLPPVTSVATEGQVSDVAQEYVIKETDTSRVKVADLFGITVEALDQANLTTPGYTAFYPGLKIIIPPGAKVPSAVPDSTAPGVTTGETLAPTTTVAPNGDGCTTGSYVITAEDTSRQKVAEKFGTTVDQLDAANANTAGYSAFYPGLKIIIPCA
jgi:LysM repeat protein